MATDTIPLGTLVQLVELLELLKNRLFIYGSVSSIQDVRNVRDLVDYLWSGNEALAALVLTVTGSIAWAINQYVLNWKAHRLKQIEQKEILIALNTEISTNIDSYKANFNDITLATAVRNVRTMERQGTRRPLITSESGDNIVFDALRKNFTILPTDMIEKIMKYYTLENEFSASYESLSNPILVQRDVQITFDLIETAHKDAQACIDHGKSLLDALKSKITQIDDDLTLSRDQHILVLFVVVLGLILCVPW